MDARPALFRIAKLLQDHGLEAVLIGNAAAALHGAPVTTVDFDFMFRKSPANLHKLKAVAKELNGVILRPYYPASDYYRLVRDEDGLQVDFMATVDGVRSLASLRSRAKFVEHDGAKLLVADLSDVVRSKKATGRTRDVAVLEILKRFCMKKRVTRKEKLAALKKESELALIDQIRRLRALPMEQRTHFFRRRIGFRMSCL